MLKIKIKSPNHLKKMSIEEMMKMDIRWKKKHANAYFKRLELFIYQIMPLIGNGEKK